MKNIGSRSITIIFVIFASTILLFAQRGPRGLPFMSGPKRFGLQYDYFDAAKFHQVAGTFSIWRDLGFRPGMAPGSHISTINLAVGVRFPSGGDSTEFRWRAGLLDADIGRGIWALGITLVDYDKSGRLEKDLRWAVIRAGLGFTLGGKHFSISPQFVGSFGGGSYDLGKINYSELGAIADTSLSGVEAGFITSLTLQLAGRIVLIGYYVKRTLVDGSEPRFRIWGGEASIFLGRFSGNGLTLHVGYLKEKADFRNSSVIQEITHLSAGIRLRVLPGRGRPENPWD